MEVNDEYEWMEEAGYRLVDGPLPVSKRQQQKGLGPSVYILAFNSIEALEKNYLAQSLSHSLTVGDPLLSQTRQLPHPLSQTSLRKAQWFDLCPMTDLFFKETVEVVKEIAPAWCTQHMHAIMQ